MSIADQIYKAAEEMAEGEDKPWDMGAWSDRHKDADIIRYQEDTILPTEAVYLSPHGKELLAKNKHPQPIRGEDCHICKGDPEDQFLCSRCKSETPSPSGSEKPDLLSKDAAKMLEICLPYMQRCTHAERWRVETDSIVRQFLDTPQGGEDE